MPRKKVQISGFLKRSRGMRFSVFSLCTQKIQRKYKENTEKTQIASQKCQISDFSQATPGPMFFCAFSVCAMFFCVFSMVSVFSCKFYQLISAASTKHKKQHRKIHRKPQTKQRTNTETTQKQHRNNTNKQQKTQK